MPANYSVHTLIVPKDVHHQGKQIFQRSPLPHVEFRICSPIAGASDALGRMALAYDILTSHYESNPTIEAYSNYHSKQFDFGEAFGLEANFGVVPREEFTADTINIKLSEVLTQLLNGENPFVVPGKYRVRPDLYDVNPLVRQFVSDFGIERTFFSRLDYRPGSNPFIGNPDAHKVVLHFRRQDIAGNELFRGLTEKELPEALRRGIHSRKLLGLDIAIEVMEKFLEPNSNVQAIIASDGFEHMAKRFRKFSKVLTNIEKLEENLLADPVSDLLHISTVGRLVGTGPSSTRRTLDAMYHADLVITASSSFPRLPCRFNDAKLLSVAFD